MSDDWNEIDREEILSVAPALLYLKRTFGTTLGGAANSPQPDSDGATRQDSGVKGNGASPESGDD